MAKTLTGLRWWEKFIENGVQGCDYMECQFGNKCCSDCNYWSTLIYSAATGWQQVLWFNDSPDRDASIVSITYYPSALPALLDNSIFPCGTYVGFF